MVFLLCDFLDDSACGPSDLFYKSKTNKRTCLFVAYLDKFYNALRELLILSPHFSDSGDITLAYLENGIRRAALLI